MIDKIVNEPVGGAHRDYAAMSNSLRRALAEALHEVSALSTSELLERRYQRLMDFGRFAEE
jgi:acetyl-CoA carboxylase carboxyl transferase subunit alpha